MKFSEIEDCSVCPLMKQSLCVGGVANENGVLREPPCCMTGENDTVEGYIARQEFLQRQQARQRADNIEKQRKADVKKQKNAYMRQFCKHERAVVNALKQQVTEQKNLIQLLTERERIDGMINGTHRLSGNTGINQAYYKRLSDLERELSIAEERLAARKEECRKSNGYKAIK